MTNLEKAVKKYREARNDITKEVGSHGIHEGVGGDNKVEIYLFCLKNFNLIDLPFTWEIVGGFMEKRVQLTKKIGHTHFTYLLSKYEMKSLECLSCDGLGAVVTEEKIKAILAGGEK